MEVIIVPGLFGGIARKYYEPLAKMLGSNDFLLFRAGADWEPGKIADGIRQIEGAKKVVCLSCGAMVGNLLTRDENTEVFYICPYMGADFINRNRKAYALRRFYKGLASVAMVISKPFMWHRWYPLFGGTRPDGWFLSVYAICKQLRYIFSESTDINSADGTVFSHGDKFVEPTVAQETSANTVAARKRNGKDPAHINLRNDAEAYLEAFAKMLNQRPR